MDTDTATCAHCQPLSAAAVNATTEVYERLLDTMLPAPAKSHYTFNLRDLAKVFQGMLSIKPEHCQDSRTFIFLWIHESQRVFQDRLISKDDKVSMTATINPRPKTETPTELERQPVGRSRGR